MPVKCQHGARAQPDVTELSDCTCLDARSKSKQKEHRRPRYLHEKTSGPMQFLKRAITPPRLRRKLIARSLELAGPFGRVVDKRASVEEKERRTRAGKEVPAAEPTVEPVRPLLFQAILAQS